MMRQSVLAGLLAAFGCFGAPNIDAHAATQYDWPICNSAKRITCVVDGDTLWFEGVKMRLLDIDTPEVKGRCEVERKGAREATLGLQRLLSQGVIRIGANGQDRYGRKLVYLYTSAGEVNSQMIEAGLAMPYGNFDKNKWCR